MKIPSLLLWGMACIALTSCKKNDQSALPPKKVYIGGTIENSGRVGVAHYWIDSSIYSFNSTGSTYTYVMDMAVSNQNVYLLTEVSLASGDFYRVYKNSTLLYELNSDTCDIRAIAVSGNDVYIAGSQYSPNTVPYYRAAVWKNGGLLFRDNSSLGTEVRNIVVNGNTVAYCGRDINLSNNVSNGRYWVNGSATTLTDCFELYSIDLSGSDVYTCGITNGSFEPAYWKNTAKTNLQGGNSTNLSEIKVVGSDIYIAGSAFVNAMRVPRLWKNAQPTTLNTPYNLGGNAFGLAVDGSDVYVVGQATHTQSNSSQVAVFWKNGTMKLLGNVSTWSEANAISVQ